MTSNTWKTGIVILMALWLAAGTVFADSLYDGAQAAEDDPQGAGLYGDHPVVLEEGDIVKVRVQERTVADVELGVNTKDESSVSSKYGTSDGGLLGRLINPFMELIGEGGIDFEDEHEFKGDGSTDRNVRLDATVTALVVDVMDNGNVIIEGRKKVKVNAEEQTLVVRGVVDPKYVDSEMTVESDMIADVEVEYIGEGQLSKRSKPGFLSRVIDLIF